MGVTVGPRWAGSCLQEPEVPRGRCPGEGHASSRTRNGYGGRGPQQVALQKEDRASK